MINGVARDFPDEGMIFRLPVSAPPGFRFYRVLKASGERVTLVPLSTSDRLDMLRAIDAERAAIGAERWATFWAAVADAAQTPRWRRYLPGTRGGA
jgi:hypothetical protein